MARTLTACPCGSGDFPRELIDAAGIFCCYVCDTCEAEKRSRYRPEIFDGQHPYASTGDEEALEIDYDG